LDEVYAVGDVASMVNPRYPDQQLRTEHWGAACSQARIAGHNVVHGPVELRIDMSLPSFWTFQFGASFKSAGSVHIADEFLVMHGSPGEARFIALYGRGGSIVAAVSVN
jgi:NADPH-dependent 2,4-dienoyl-CoA reductase/sulfur reductase-like enzyme